MAKDAKPETDIELKKTFCDRQQRLWTNIFTYFGNAYEKLEKLLPNSRIGRLNHTYRALRLKYDCEECAYKSDPEKCPTFSKEYANFLAQHHK